jgi:hypothetical protein
VLDEKLPKTRTGRFWIYFGDLRNRYAAYDYTESRKRDGPATFLKDYRGYLQADAYGGYDGIYAGGLVKQVSCWAHARRKFFEAKEAQPSEAHEALAYIGRLYEVERAAKELTPDERLRLRLQRSLPLLAELRARLEQLRGAVLPKSPVGQAVGYVLPRWESFVRYCEDPALAIDNNLSERSLRPCAIGRKNWLFLGNDQAGRTAAVLYSFTMSCKANAVEPWAYLRDVIQRLAEATPDSPDELDRLLPDAWLKTHPEARREWSR